jgi:hypothetical protein
MGSLLERLAEREAVVRGRVERLRAEIAALSAELADEEKVLSRLTVTRETVLDLLAGDEQAGDERDVVAGRGVAAPPAVAVDDRVPGSGVDERVVDVFAAAGRGLRAREVCRLLDVGAEDRQVEGMRSRLKRLVRRGVLAEPEPGMFVMAGGSGAAGPATV